MWTFGSAPEVKILIRSFCFGWYKKVLCVQINFMFITLISKNIIKSLNHSTNQSVLFTMTFLHIYANWHKRLNLVYLKKSK